MLDGAVFQSRPEAFDATPHRFRLLEFPDCLGAIEAACAGIRRLNPAAAVVLTVSRLPLRATFRFDVTAVTANCYSNPWKDYSFRHRELGFRLYADPATFIENLFRRETERSAMLFAEPARFRAENDGPEVRYDVLAIESRWLA